MKWNAVLDVWQSGQTRLPNLVCWGKHVVRGGVRIQDALQHTYSSLFLANVLFATLRKYLLLDERFITQAIFIHAQGKSELGQDTSYIDETDETRLREYLAFRARFEKLGETVFREFHRAFLLQFALMNPPVFPDDARAIMRELAERHRLEALAFQAIEHWDFLMYAMEQYRERDNHKLLVQVLRNVMPKLDRLATNLVGFYSEIWTDELRAWCAGFLSEHEGQWIEQQGEG